MFICFARQFITNDDGGERCVRYEDMGRLEMNAARLRCLFQFNRDLEDWRTASAVAGDRNGNTLRRMEKNCAGCGGGC